MEHNFNITHYQKVKETHNTFHCLLFFYSSEASKHSLFRISSTICLATRCCDFSMNQKPACSVPDRGFCESQNTEVMLAYL